VAADASMDPLNTFGVGGGWGGNRFRSAFVDKFTDISGETDTRANFFTTDRTKEIDNQNAFSEGYSCTKFKNVTSTGAAGQNETFVDTDFPLFRLADVYLMYAEAVLRGGTGGDAQVALSLVNELRERAYGDTSGNITAGELNLQFILDERARELYWETHRRTDLIRFGQFTGDAYKWDWKGNVKEGAGISDHLALFPLPASDLITNTNLIQNTGY
jgi:starch-binding outer membrane protein, SusD/RagB family